MEYIDNSGIIERHIIYSLNGYLKGPCVCAPKVYLFVLLVIVVSSNISHEKITREILASRETRTHTYNVNHV